jgi:amidase
MGLDFATATATALTTAIRNREISSRELLEFLLARIETVNPALNAIVALDCDRARAAADAADQRAAHGDLAGPLHGLPMTVKDTFETEGLITTSGAKDLADYRPQRDAVAVARLKAAGAIVFGKSNTPLYAGDWQTYNDVYGRTNNPWDHSRTAGGSSGGAAAAVAAGITPLDFGSDIGGSIRNPAHYNGVYGLKPSWGVVPVRGHIPGPPGSLVQADVGVVGPIARSVADLKLVLDVVAGPLPHDAAGWRLDLDPGLGLTDVTQLRVATVFDEGHDVIPVAADVRANLDAFAARLAAAGAKVSAASLPVPLADAFRSWQNLTLPIIGVGLPEAEYAKLAKLESEPGESDELVVGRALTSRYRAWISACELRERQREAWAEFFAGYDAVLAPIMPTAAFRHDTDRPMNERVLAVAGRPVTHFAASAWCGAIGAMLLPAVALPTGPNQAGLPVGVQVIGPYLADQRLLRIAGLIDQAAGPGFTAPPVSG